MSRSKRLIGDAHAAPALGVTYSVTLISTTPADPASHPLSPAPGCTCVSALRLSLRSRQSTLWPKNFAPQSFSCAPNTPGQGGSHFSPRCAQPRSIPRISYPAGEVILRVAANAGRMVATQPSKWTPWNQADPLMRPPGASTPPSSRPSYWNNASGPVPLCLQWP